VCCAVGTARTLGMPTVPFLEKESRADPDPVAGRRCVALGRLMRCSQAPHKFVTYVVTQGGVARWLPGLCIPGSHRAVAPWFGAQPFLLCPFSTGSRGFE